MKKSILGLAFVSLLGASQAMSAEYDVTITNVSHGTIFTPIFVISHKPGIKLFELGHPASSELAAIAEGGDFSSLATSLQGDTRVVDTADSAALLPDSSGLLLPGASVTVSLRAPNGSGQISLASMMLPTNDGFIALNGVDIPRNQRSVSYYSPGYDAGSEPNDELCVSIPGGGPCGGGEGGSPGAGGEDYVHIHSGIHGIGDLSSSSHDWHNPAAHITIKRVNR
jgi:hypothetical protein